jgi:hypothetical protein
MGFFDQDRSNSGGNQGMGGNYNGKSSSLSAPAAPAAASTKAPAFDYSKGNGSSRAAAAPAPLSAEAALSADNKAAQANWKANFKQQLDDYANSALTDRTLIDRADFNSQLTAKAAKGVSARSLSRSGVALTGQAAKQSARLGNINTAQYMDQSKNTAVVAQDDRNTQALGDSLNAYTQIGETGSAALRNAAGLESQRIAGDKQRKGAADASNMGMAASLASMMIL